MPYVLQHKETAQIYTCMLVNHYKLNYYGVKFWEDASEAGAQANAFLRERGVEDPDSWQVAELEEGQMKISNVRLKNDPERLLFWNEAGKPEVRKK